MLVPEDYNADYVPVDNMEEYAMGGSPASASPGLFEPSQSELITEAALPWAEHKGHPIEQADKFDKYVLMRTEALPLGPDYTRTEFGREVRETIALRQQFVKNPELMVYSMNRLAVTAETADLAHMRYGMYGYSMVTSNCIDRLESTGPDKFDFPDKIRETMPVFFGELLKAFDHHINGRQAAVVGWQKQFYSQAARQAPPAMEMIDFLSAHVRYDLAVALLRTNTQDNHKHDYTEKINEILTDVSMEIVNKYAEFPAVMRALGVNKMGLRLALWELFNGRDEAWITAKRMQMTDNFADYAQIRQNQKWQTEVRTFSRMPLARSIFNIATRTPADQWEGEDALVARPPSIALRRAMGGLIVPDVTKST